MQGKGALALKFNNNFKNKNFKFPVGSLAVVRAVVCLLLVVKRKAYSLVKGNVIWQRMEANNLCGGHRYTTLLHNTLQDAFWTNLYSINENSSFPPRSSQSMKESCSLLLNYFLPQDLAVHEGTLPQANHSSYPDLWPHVEAGGEVQGSVRSSSPKQVRKSVLVDPE